MRYCFPFLILLSLPASCAHACARGKHEAPGGVPATAYLLGLYLILICDAGASLAVGASLDYALYTFLLS